MATTNRNWTEPTVSGSENQWGSLLNTILTSLDAILGTATALSTTGGTTTLTQSQQNSAGFVLSGTLSTPAVIAFNGNGGVWVVNNGCVVGAYSVTVKVTGQTGFVVPSGATVLAWCNGTDLVQIANLVDIDGQTALTDPAVDDESLTYDTSAGGNRKITNANLLKVVNALTEDAAPDGAADFILSYDASASLPKKVLHDNVRPREAIIVQVVGDTAVLAAGTGKFTFRMPWAFHVTEVRASLATAQTGGTVVTVDINESGTSIISTKLTLDNGEKTSTTAITPPVISDAALADDAEMSIDIDAIGDGTAKGLKCAILGYRTG